MGVIDIGTQRVQRHATFAVPFGPCDLGTAKTTGNVHTDTKGTHTHGVLHGTLHGTTEGDTTLKLLCNALTDQSRVQFRLADLDDVQVQFACRQLGQLLAKGFDIGAFFADDHARTCSVDRHAALLVRTFNDHACDPGLLGLFLDELADFQVFQKKVPVILGIGVPAAIPGAVDLEAHADRIDFLTH